MFKRKLKKGLKDNTFSNYRYMYDQFVYEELGKQRVVLLKRSETAALMITLRKASVRDREIYLFSEHIRPKRLKRTYNWYTTDLPPADA